MSYYLATHEDSGHELFSHRDDARSWVEYQADFHEQQIGKWVTHGEEESLRLADGRTYVGTVRSMTLDQRAEHRQYEAEQRAAKREAQEAAEVAEVAALRARVAELTAFPTRAEVERLREQVAELTSALDEAQSETGGEQR